MLTRDIIDSQESERYEHFYYPVLEQIHDRAKELIETEIIEKIVCKYSMEDGSAISYRFSSRIESLIPEKYCKMINPIFSHIIWHTIKFQCSYIEEFEFDFNPSFSSFSKGHFYSDRYILPSQEKTFVTFRRNQQSKDVAIQFTANQKLSPPFQFEFHLIYNPQFKLQYGESISYPIIPEENK